MGRDEYSDLKPVADLIRVLSEHIVIFISNPLRIEPNNSTDELISEAIDNVAREIFKLLHNYIPEIIFLNKISEWSLAYSYRGIGSSRVRARDIKNIYDNAAPIPGEIPSIDSNRFISEIRELIREGIKSGGGEVVRK